MRYTEALEEIYKDRTKIFRAYSSAGGDVYELDGSDLFITMRYLSIDEPVTFLSYKMMDLDWQEEKLTGLQRLDRDYEKWSEQNE